MSERTAKTMVLLAGGLMFAAIGIKHDAISDPFRFAWAASAITLFLSLLADISPPIAGPAAILVLLAVYAKNRGVLGSVIPTTANTSTAGAAAGASAGAGAGSSSSTQGGSR